MDIYTVYPIILINTIVQSTVGVNHLKEMNGIVMILLYTQTVSEELPLLLWDDINV